MPSGRGSVRAPRRSRTRYFDTEEDILAADAWQSSVWRSRWSACPQDGLAGDLCRRNIEDVHCSVQFLGSKWTTLDRRLMLIWLEWIYVIDLRRLLAFRYSIEYSTYSLFLVLVLMVKVTDF